MTPSLVNAGVTLSGGQQQRLAIARAILAGAAFSSLMKLRVLLTESEQLIQQAMDTLLAGRTTFVIAHRLTTVRSSDLTWLLKMGASSNVGHTTDS